MIEISTTATFDRLFQDLPKHIQRKAATRTDLFKENPFHPSLRTEKLHPKHMKSGVFGLTEPIESSSSL